MIKSPELRTFPVTLTLTFPVQGHILSLKFGISFAFMAGAASQAGDADSSWAPGLTSGLQGSVNVHRGALLLVSQWQCISSFVFCNPSIPSLAVFCSVFQREKWTSWWTSCSSFMRRWQIGKMKGTRRWRLQWTKPSTSISIVQFSDKKFKYYRDSNQCFYAPSLKGPPGHLVIRSSVCLSVRLSVIPSRLQTKCII